MKTDFTGYEEKIVCKKKYSKESKRVKRNWAIYIVVVVVLIFTLSFLNYSLFYFILFHDIFLLSTFSGTHVCTVGTASYAPGNIA